jgi:hypothetical protein
MLKVPNIISKDAKGTNKYTRDVGGNMFKNIIYFILFWPMIGVRGHIGEHNKMDIGEH